MKPTQDNGIVVLNGKISNSNPLNVKFVAPASDAICSRCAQPATPYTTPPLCEHHLDLLMLLDHMQKQGVLLTLANAQQHLQRALDYGGDWAITPETLPGLFNDFINQD